MRSAPTPPSARNRLLRRIAEAGPRCQWWPCLLTCMGARISF